MGKQAIVSFPADQWATEEEELLGEQPIEFEGEYVGSRDGRLHVRLDPDLDRAFLEKRARILIPQAYNKEYRGVYVGDDEEKNAVFGRINQVR